MGSEMCIRDSLDRPFWRQFELAWAHLVSGELSPRRISSKISSLLWRRFQSRVPHTFRHRIRSLASSRGNFPAAHPHLSPRFERSPARGWRNRAVSKRSVLARPHTFLRILSWRQRRRDRRKPSNRLDRSRRKTDRTKRRVTCPSSQSGKQHSRTRRNFFA